MYLRITVHRRPDHSEEIVFSFDRTTTHLTLAAATASLFALLSPAISSAQGVEANPGSQNPEDPEADTSASEPVWLGVQIDEKAETFDGARISKTLDQSPAARAGLEAGDMLLAVEDRSIPDLATLREALEEYAPGDKVTIRLRRKGADDDQTVRATLSAKPARTTIVRNQLVGTTLSEMSLVDLDGEAVDVEDYRGKPLVLEFWATWCFPCRKVQQTLTELDGQFGEAIQILGISAEDQHRLVEYRNDSDLPYPIVRDDERSVHDELFIGTFPTVVVAGPDGEIVEVLVGADSADRLESMLREMIE